MNLKAILYILPFFLFQSFSTSGQSINQHQEIDLDAISTVYIKKELFGQDSILLGAYQIEQLVASWNKGNNLGLVKVKPKFWMSLKFKDNSTRRFVIDNEVMKEHSDLAFSIGKSGQFDMFWDSVHEYPRPRDYTPKTFLRAVSSRFSNSEKYRPISMGENFPLDWVKEAHLEELFDVLDSQQNCGGFRHPRSSRFGCFDAEIGGYARIFINSFKEQKPIDFGGNACPKVDEEENEALKKWWSERKQASD